jgi:hypothetical protein
MVVLTVLLTEQLLLGISKEGVLTESLTDVPNGSVRGTLGVLTVVLTIFIKYIFSPSTPT